MLKIIGPCKPTARALPVAMAITELSLSRVWLVISQRGRVTWRASSQCTLQVHAPGQGLVVTNQLHCPSWGKGEAVTRLSQVKRAAWRNTQRDQGMEGGVSAAWLENSEGRRCSGSAYAAQREPRLQRAVVQESTLSPFGEG